MNLKRFTARTSREALALVKIAFGEDAVVMSTKPCEEGVEVLAMAPESLDQLERLGQAAENVTMTPRPSTLREKAQPPRARAVDRLMHRGSQRSEPNAGLRTEPHLDDGVQADVEQLQMSTLSFQDYVRDRMLRRRDAEGAADQPSEPPAPMPLPPQVAPIAAARARAVRREMPMAQPVPQPMPMPQAQPQAQPQPGAFPVLRDELSPPPARASRAPQAAQAAGEQVELMTELRSMRGLIEQRFGALAFMEKLQRHPRQAKLSRRLLDAGFSPMLIRKLVDSLPPEGDEDAWAASVLERNVLTGEQESPLEDQGGIHALIGATGVGKTTSTAKLAAAFATRHGAGNLGLITLDAYRVGAHEQLRAYGRILGVPVHTAHDRDSLEDLLDLLSAKRMVLIDTAGMAQRDSRTRELLDMLSHKAIHRLLVVSASAQGETIEDQLSAYGAAGCKGLVLSKLDEAVKLGPALDALIRHKLKVLAVANGQRVPEDWHRLSAQALVQRALKPAGGAAWQVDERDVNLIFAGLPAAPMPTPTALHV
jgi:flagellar biosynthesis protein FlhF